MYFLCKFIKFAVNLTVTCINLAYKSNVTIIVQTYMYVAKVKYKVKYLLLTKVKYLVMVFGIIIAYNH